MVETVKTLEQFDKTIKENELVLVDFFATWCGPCKTLSPIIEKLSDKYQNVKFIKVDVDVLSPLAARYGINSIPNLILFKNGEKAGQGVGFMPETKVAELIEKAG